MRPSAEVSSSPLRVVLLTGGHGYQRPAYLSMLSDPELLVTHVEHTGPTASGWEHESLERCDAVLLYDLQQHITEAQRARFMAVLARGAGLLVTHHALVSFQGWPEYERIIGGRYVEGSPGVAGPASSYRLDVDVPVQILDGAHPVTRGLQDFTLRDEIYIGFRVGKDVTPLLVTSQPQSSNPIAWTRCEGAARIVYLQPGHGPETYASPSYRRLLGNALRFVARRAPS